MLGTLLTPLLPSLTIAPSVVTARMKTQINRERLRLVSFLWAKKKKTEGIKPAKMYDNKKSPNNCFNRQHLLLKEQMESVQS